MSDDTIREALEEAKKRAAEVHGYSAIDKINEALADLASRQSELGTVDEEARKLAQFIGMNWASEEEIQAFSERIAATMRKREKATDSLLLDAYGLLQIDKAIIDQDDGGEWDRDRLEFVRNFCKREKGIPGQPRAETAETTPIASDGEPDYWDSPESPTAPKSEGRTCDHQEGYYLDGGAGTRGSWHCTKCDLYFSEKPTAPSSEEGKNGN